MVAKFLLLLLFIWAGCANRQADNDLLALLLSKNNNANQSILILGDSLTEYSRGFGLPVMLAGRYLVDWKGAPNQNIPYWTNRLPAALANANQPYTTIILPMGTNDAFNFSSEQFLANVQDFQRLLRNYSSAAIYYCKLPLSNIAALQPKIAANNQILAANLPTGSAGLIDLEKAFLQAPMPAALYTQTDPLHPNQSGYRLIGETMRNYLFLVK